MRRSVRRRLRRPSVRDCAPVSAAAARFECFELLRPRGTARFTRLRSRTNLLSLAENWLEIVINFLCVKFTLVTAGQTIWADPY